MKNFIRLNLLPLGILIIALLIAFIGCHAHAGEIVTAAPAASSAEDTFNWLVNWNNKLLGAPSGVLVLVVVFLFDAVLYYAEFFRNRNIPVFSIVAGGLIYCLISVRGDTTLPERVWIAKNIVIGCIIGCVAWIGSLRYGMKLIGTIAGKPDPSPPLPEVPAQPAIPKIEVVVEQKPPATP